MGRQLTAEEKAAYVASGYSKCPYCQSDAIDGGPVEIDCNQAVQEVSCTACERTWRDVYTLSDVEDVY